MTIESAAEEGSPATLGRGAVFLSYASEDAAAAERICAALRTAGIEVWLDRSELRGGDAWDAAIRRQIKSCALFIPIISRNAHARAEGYFRLEWKLAIDRSYLIASDRPFLVPVAIDATPQSDERIPDRFRELHWTVLPDGATPASFVQRVSRLLANSDEAHSAPPVAAAAPLVRSQERAPGRAKGPRSVLLVGLAVLAAVAILGYLGIRQFQGAGGRTTQPVGVAAAPPAAAAPETTGGFHPPPHSVAVLPFVNLSGDKEQEYFSDGLSEELLNSLSRIDNLQVAARTSSFFFKGKDAKLATIARELNVAAVLEGSVRRSGNTVRITAQLVNAVSGFQLWSDTYDRGVGDVLKVQTEIANSVASALKVTLLGDTAAKIELGGTRNPAALDAYLQGMVAYNISRDGPGLQVAVAAFAKAIQLDPNYAQAFAARAMALSAYGQQYAIADSQSKVFAQAVADARHALALAPDLSEGHAALAQALEDTPATFQQAGSEFRRALELSPNNPRILTRYAIHAANVGDFDAATAAARRAVTADPLNPRAYRALGDVLQFSRHFPESILAYDQSLKLDPGAPQSYARRGMSYYLIGEYESARKSCEVMTGDWENEMCLSLAYAKLGRRADAEAQVAKIFSELGEGASYQFLQIYAQWGNIPKALEWLDSAVRIQDPGLQGLKTDPMLDPLRNEPRFQGVLRTLRLAD